MPQRAYRAEIDKHVASRMRDYCKRTGVTQVEYLSKLIANDIASKDTTLQRHFAIIHEDGTIDESSVSLWFFVTLLKGHGVAVGMFNGVPRNGVRNALARKFDGRDCDYISLYAITHRLLSLRNTPHSAISDLFLPTALSFTRTRAPTADAIDNAVSVWLDRAHVTEPCGQRARLWFALRTLAQFWGHQWSAELKFTVLQDVARMLRATDGLQVAGFSDYARGDCRTKERQFIAAMSALTGTEFWKG